MLARFVSAKQTPLPEPEAVPEETADLAPIAQAMSQIEARLEEARAEAAPEAASAEPATVEPTTFEPATFEPAQEPSGAPVQEEKKQEEEKQEEEKKKKRKKKSGRNCKILRLRRRNRPISHAGIRCASSGKWTQRDASVSLPANSSDVIGPAVAAAMGRPWSEIARELALDPDGEILRAIATRNTWSGITVDWPVENSNERLPVELSGLPIFDRDRLFRGYRGFGVCRDVARIENLMTRRYVREPDEAAAPEPRPENIVPFRNGSDSENGNGATLTPVERTAFRELSSRLTARLQGADALATGRAPSNDDDQVAAGIPVADLGVAAAAVATSKPETDPLDPERPLLDRLPVGILIYRHSHFIYANASFLNWTGHKTLADFSQAGGLDTLFIETHADGSEGNGGQSLRLADPAGTQTPVDARLFTIPYDGSTAMALVLVPAADNAEMAATIKTAETELTELKAILDIAADGVLILDRGWHDRSSQQSRFRYFRYRARRACRNIAL